MTGATPIDPRDADDILAAEYVLGVQSLPDRMATEARIRSDAAFAAQVAAWEDRLSALNDGYPDAAPPPDMMDRIEARLFPAPAPQPSAFRRFAGWIGGAVTAAALLLAVALFLPPAPALVAVMGDGGLRFEARFGDGALTVTRVAGHAAPEGQTQELWLIAPDAAPVSLGLLADGPLNVPYPEAPAGWTLAVSVEPAGGSPTGAPTGPVVAAGVIGDL